ncbi:MAG: hypothetical protein HYZ36_00680, partial [Pedosphaera parvula]|nr:hypothetical protein [Pedosphaera parvula]
HPAIPSTSYLSDLKEIPADLHNYVLKPLFSFAGTGVKIDVTHADIDAVPDRDRHNFILQRKVEYAQALTMPDGTGVKAEVRVMLARPPAEITLGDVLRSVHGQVFDTPALSDPQCPPELRVAWQKLQTAANQAADAVTFQKLLDDGLDKAKMYYI